MALFEALGELVGAAIISAAPACDVRLSAAQSTKYRELTPWLRSNAGAAAADAIIDALARDIWVSAETRGLAQQSLERHALAVAELLVAHPPQSAHMKQAIDRARTGAAGQMSATADPVARRIAVDVFGRARASLGTQPQPLKDDVALLLIDRVYAHLLDDPKVLFGLAPALTEFIAKQSAQEGAAASSTTPSGIASLGLSNVFVEGLNAAGGPSFLADLRERFGLNDKALRRVLGLLDAQGVRGEHIAPRVEELAAWLGDVRAQLLKATNEEAEVRRLKAKAAQALADGDFEAAEEALKLLRREVRESRRRIEERLAEEVSSLRTQMMEEARATARLAELALANLDFRNAAELFGESSLALPTSDRDLAWQYNLQRAEALYRHGETALDASSLNDAIAAYGHAVRLVADGSNQKGLGAASLGLGNALALAGTREAGTARLKDAATSFRKAINIVGRESDPKSWSMAQLRLGRCLALIGERDQAPPVLRDATQAFREALQEIRADRAPTDFIGAQMGLGNALLGLEEREGGTALLAEAAEAYRAAIANLSPASEPLLWADAQMNLGLALLGLGEQQNGTDHLQGAVVAFRAALEVSTRKAAPQKWALIHLNLGNALAALGDRDRQSPHRLDEAIVAYNGALEEFRRDSEPLKWAIAQMNLGTALIRVGEHREKRRNWLAAAGALVPALEVFETHGAEAYADVTRRNLRRFHESWDTLIAAPNATATAPSESAKPRLSKAV